MTAAQSAKLAALESTLKYLKQGATTKRDRQMIAKAEVAIDLMKSGNATGAVVILESAA